VLGLNAYIKW